MRLLVLVGLFTAAMAPFAAAAENTAECEVDDTRRNAQQRVEEQPAAETTRTARPTAMREATAQQARNEPRRRSGSRKRIPDAVLIGGRGAL